MPESYSFLIKVNKKEKLVQTLNRVEKDVTFSEKDEYVIHVSDDNDTSLKKLFTDKRGLSTVMFWVAAFMSLLVMYGLSTWLPKIMQNAGYPMGSSLLFLVTLNLGGVTGAIFGGKLADKFGSRKVLLVFFIIRIPIIISLKLKTKCLFIICIALYCRCNYYGHSNQHKCLCFTILSIRYSFNRCRLGIRNWKNWRYAWTYTWRFPIKLTTSIPYQLPIVCHSEYLWSHSDSISTGKIRSNQKNTNEPYMV